MKSINYTIDRSRIYLGEVGKIFNYTEYYVNGKEDKRSYIDGYCPCRYMLFVMSDDGHAKDLLYESKNYPVLGHANSSDFLKKEQTIGVVKSACLDDLLKAYDYPEKLGYVDIMRFLLDFCYCDYFTLTQDSDGLFTTSDTLYRNSYPGVYEEQNINLATFTASSLRRDAKRRIKPNKCSHLKEAKYGVESEELKNLLFYINKINNEKLRGPFQPALFEEGFVRTLRSM